MKNATAEQKRHWRDIALLGCIICGGPANIHHIFTGGGGRKNHDFVLPLCFFHHQGLEGIHTIGRKAWQEKFGTEQENFELSEKRLVESKIR